MVLMGALEIRKRQSMTEENKSLNWENLRDKLEELKNNSAEVTDDEDDQSEPAKNKVVENWAKLTKKLLKR